MTYRLSTDSSADMDRSFAGENNIGIINYKYSLNGEEYEDDGGRTLPYDDFYQALSAGGKSQTSAINTAEFIEYFKGFLEKGQNIVHISLSSGLSSSYDNALRAKEVLEKDFPARKIYIVDSLMASAGISLLVSKLVSLKEEGYSDEDLFTWAEDNKTRINAWYTTTDLEHFVNGGRISAPAGWIGGKLKICPLMTVDEKGKLGVDQIVRSKNKAINILKEKFYNNSTKEDGAIIIDSMLKEDAEKIKKDITENHPDLEGKITINRIGTTIGSHTGPKTLGIFFWSKEDRWDV